MCTFSPALITSRVGPKPFYWQISQQRASPQHSLPHVWISRFGIPSTVTTDRGRQFESSLWKQFTQLLGTKRLRTTAYHPISNDLIERFHRHLKSALKAQPQPEHWIDSLPLVLLGICRMTYTALLWNWFTAQVYACQESSSHPAMTTVWTLLATWPS